MIISALLFLSLLLSFLHLRSIKKVIGLKEKYVRQLKKVTNLREQLSSQYPYRKTEAGINKSRKKFEVEKGALSQITAMLSGRKWARTIALRASASTYAVTFYLISLPSFSGEHSLIFLSLFVFLLVGWTLLTHFTLKKERSATTSIKLELDLI